MFSDHHLIMFLKLAIIFIITLVGITSGEHEPNVVQIRAFGEGRCPDTSRWFRKHLMPVWKLFGSSKRLNITYHPFGVKTSCWNKRNDDIGCKCQHGPAECELNQLQACTIDRLPDPVDHIPLVECIQGRTDAAEASKICFHTGITKFSPDEMLKCANSLEGKKLFWAHEKYQHKYAPSLDWVPWIMINGKRVKEGEKDLWQILCDRYLHPRPEECPKNLFYL